MIFFCITGEGFGSYPWWIYGLLVISGICDFVAFNCRNIAFQSDSSGFIALIGYIAVFYGFLSDVFIFNASMTVMAVGGAVLIMIVTVGTAVYKLKQAEKEKA